LEGLRGYTDDILTLVSGLYNVDLNEWKRNNYLLPLVEFFGPNGKFTKVGNKLHRSVAVFDYFDIYFDSIDIDRPEEDYGCQRQEWLAKRNAGVAGFLQKGVHRGL
jgi:hypothetical protein